MGGEYRFLFDFCYLLPSPPYLRGDIYCTGYKPGGFFFCRWSIHASTDTADRCFVDAQPFFNLTLQAGNPRLAATFVPKCTNVEHGETITMYEKCGMKVKAAEEAVRLKNKEAFTKILEAAGRNTHEGREIERLGATVFKP